MSPYGRYWCLQQQGHWLALVCYITFIFLSKWTWGQLTHIQTHICGCSVNAVTLPQHFSMWVKCRLKVCSLSCVNHDFLSVIPSLSSLCFFFPFLFCFHASLLFSLSLSHYSSDEAVSWSTAVKTRLTSCWQRAESGAEAKKTVEMDLSMPLVISLNIIKSFYSFRSSRGPGLGWRTLSRGLHSPLSLALPGELHAVAAVRSAAAAKQGHLTAFNCSCLSAVAWKNMLAVLWKTKKCVLVSLRLTAGETVAVGQRQKS